MYNYAEELARYLAEPDEITSSIVGYASATLFPTLDKGVDAIETSCVASSDFTAKVRRNRSGTFDIRAYEGVAAALGAALRPLSGGARETLEALSLRIFGDAERSHIVAGSLLGNAIVFVLLHEYGHIAGGHFGYRQHLHADAEVAFDFDEVRDAFSIRGAALEEIQVGKMLELEADLLAFNFLLDLSYPIFVSDEGVAAHIVGREFEDWRDDLYPPVAELAFYAASAALALIAAHQDPAAGNYPRPLTRMMNLASLLLRRTTISTWASEDGLSHYLKVDEAVQRQIASFFAPALLNAIELSEALCLNIGLDLRAWMNLVEGDIQVMQALTQDFIGLIKGDSPALLTAEARELASLQGQLAAFSETMKPFRVRSWWT